MAWSAAHRAEKVRRAHERRNYGGTRFLAGWCKECGESFVVVSDFRPQSFCSKRCQIRENRRRQGARRRARLEGFHSDLIELSVLAERDGWRCHICRREVTRKTWSVDHLMPLSLGGADTYENVALAHHLCNARRGAREPSQLTLWAPALRQPRRSQPCEVCGADFYPKRRTARFCGVGCSAEHKRRYNTSRYRTVVQSDEWREERNATERNRRAQRSPEQAEIERERDRVRMRARRARKVSA